ncbi:hypothetical protein [Frankia sp. Cj5]|uniref:hypothetical protein n=1 Tax=Frankia sp. Cj5 TaxID=2880978 RepID=UPI001EF4BFF2|nr:hypothetical protein [Frankia sp. Cj5]
MNVTDRGRLCHGLPHALLVLGVLTCWLVVTASPASAHSVNGGGATNLRTTLTGMNPPVDGITLTPVENGSRVRLTVIGNHTVIVKGYSDEPYLRVDPTGTWRNALSSETYLNTSRYGLANGSSKPLTGSDDTAPPRWEKIGHGGTTVWHDHRTHWMGAQDPPVVLAAPGRFHEIYTWMIPLTVDGQTVNVTGALDWIPGPSPTPWFVLGIMLAAGVMALGLLRRAATALAAAVTITVAADITHSLLITFSRADGRLSGFFLSNTVEMAAWALGLGSAALLIRESITGGYLAATAGFVIAMVGGFGDVGLLYRSGAPIAGPVALARLLTTVTIGIGIGLLAAVPVVTRRHGWRKQPGTDRDTTDRDTTEQQTVVQKATEQDAADRSGYGQAGPGLGAGPKQPGLCPDAETEPGMGRSRPDMAG